MAYIISQIGHYNMFLVENVIAYDSQAVYPI